VPSFCRHNRLEATCPICSRKAAATGLTPARRSAPRTPRPASSPTRRRSPRAAGDLRVHRVARAADDGYEHELVPGLRASADAARLAGELAFAAARLEELEHDPPGLYAEVAAIDDVEEAAWLAFQIAYLSPLEDEAPFAAIEAARTSWASGEPPRLDGAAPGPRSAHDPRRGAATPEAYRAWATRAGSQAAALEGEASWPAQRRFERAFERLALPGFGRSPRYELLVLLGRLGVVDLRPWSLHLVEALDPVVVAAKRVFGIGDALNLQRRASELATAAGVPVEALDLALVNWSRPPEEGIAAGATVTADPAREAAIARTLGVDPAG
jgi:hypothetical protein